MTTHAITESYLGRAPAPRRTVDIGGFIWTVTKLLSGEPVQWRGRNHGVDFVVEVRDGEARASFTAPVRCDDRSTPVDLPVRFGRMEASPENVDFLLMTGAALPRASIERLIDVEWARLGAELNRYHEAVG